MQTTGVSMVAVSDNLSLAISHLEEMLNKQDSEAILQTIKNYKQSKNSLDTRLKS